MKQGGGRLAGKVALISGGAGGQGSVEARLFVQEGANVVVGDVRDSGGSALCAELGAKALFVELDVRNEDSWAQAVDSTEDRYGGLDVLINNAGVMLEAEMVATTVAAFMHVIDVNQLGVFLGMRSVADAMSARGGGSIVNISSDVGIMGEKGLFAYAASKWAVTGMTKCAALELAPRSIRVNSVHPGPVHTRMIARSGSLDELNAEFAHQPIPRVAEPIEIAYLALYLASHESSYCTGAEFVVDGGATAGVNLAGARALNDQS